MLRQYYLKHKVRLWISVTAGLLAAIATCAVQVRFYDSKAADLTWALVGARQWLHGQNPYTMPTDLTVYPYDPSPLFYPFPAVLLVLPLSFLPDVIAATIWIGLSVGLMTYILTAEGLWRLAILASAPLWAAVAQVQWTPLLVSMWIFPVLLPLALLKPNSGVALASKKITKKGLIGLLLIILVSLILLPGWPLSWLESIKHGRHLIPILFGPGPLLIFAAFRWRNPEARLLLLLACMPQTFYFYDQLALLLIAKNLRQQLIIVIASWVALGATVFIGPTWNWSALWSPSIIDGPAGWIIVFIYGTALIFTLSSKQNILVSKIHRITEKADRVRAVPKST
jgi:hypothetical protein